MIIVTGKPDRHIHALGSRNAEVAAEAALATWEEHRDNPDGIFVSVPVEVEAVIGARGPIPWERSSGPSP
jgi:hypothetical protein